MRKWSARKIVTVAAAVCVLGTITAVAAGKITQTSSHSYHTNDFTYDKLEEMEKGSDLPPGRRRHSAMGSGSAPERRWSGPVRTIRSRLYSREPIFP